MKTSRLWVATVMALFACLPLAAQDTESQPPVPPSPSGTPANEAPEPEPSTAPQTFVESASPATFGAATAIGANGRLIVADVVQSSEAAVAGLSVGDQIVSINGNLITEPDEFNSYLAAHPADTMEIVVVRDGVQQTLVVNALSNSTETSESRPALGVRFLQGNNVVLGEVLTGSPAERAGLQPGDHVIAVNDTAVASTDHFINLVAAAPLDSSMDLTCVRGADRTTITLTPGSWDVVFGSDSRHTTFKPVVSDADDAAPVTCYATPHYYSTGMSPVGVPTIAFPTHYGWPYGYTYWGYPSYYTYYGGYYLHPNWYLHRWPTWPVYSRPFPGYPETATWKSRTDSARVTVPGGDRLVEQVSEVSDIE